jgi:flagellar motility protein MotE (MotC chaperone)
MNSITDQRGSAAFVIIVLLWLVLFFLGAVGYMLYREGYLRIDYGPPPKTEELVVYDENTIAQIKKKEEVLVRQERELKRKKEQLEKLRAQFEIQQQAITKKQDEVSKHLAKIEAYFDKFTEEEEEDLKRLARVYENMKPDRVVPIFEEIDTETIAELLMRMKDRTSAKILAELGQVNANRAAEISDIMQGKDKGAALSQAIR